MKNRYFFMSMSLIITMMISSCEQNLTVDGYTGSLTTVDALKSANVYLPGEVTTVDVCQIAEFNLTAGQYTPIGSVELFNDATNLYITYTTTESFGTLHLWVGKDLALLPKTKTGNPIPGKFPYSFSATGLQSYTFKIPLANLDLTCNSQFFFVAHAEVLFDTNDDGIIEKTETAFGGNSGINIGEPGRWYFYGSDQVDCCTFQVKEPEYNKETAFAYSADKATCFLTMNITANRWGWTNGPLEEGDYTSDIWAGAGQCLLSAGTKVGTLTMSYHNGSAVVTYTMFSGFKMDAAHLYVGSDILPLVVKGNPNAVPLQYEYTVAPGQYPYIEDLTNAATWSYTVTGLSGAVYLVAHAEVLVPVN